MKSFSSPRAGRPVKARVSTVVVRAGSASAARCVADAPLSSVRNKTVPTIAACAPARSTAAICADVDRPPAAMIGSGTAAATWATNSVIATSASGTCGLKVPECPPAPMACTASRSAPASAAARASRAFVTVWITALPTPCSAAMTAAPGRPKVKLTSGTGWANSTSILSRQLSSSSRGSAGSVTP